MGAVVMPGEQRSLENFKRTRELALAEAVRRQRLADKGYFTSSGGRTCDIEQEIQALNIQDGSPCDVSSFFDDNSIGIRPDTARYNIEYDGSGVADLTSQGLAVLYDSFARRTDLIQRNLPKGAFLVPIGANPLLNSDQARGWMVKPTSNLSYRYLLMDSATKEENPCKNVQIECSETDERIIEPASYVTAMSRTSGTQFHISERSVEDALDAHRTSIAIAPFMIAAFGNSPFLNGMDTGRSSARIELLRQAEQKRAGLPNPARNLYEYYLHNVLDVETPFVEINDQARALDLSHGATHRLSRLIVSIPKNGDGTIRNEYRHIDSQAPLKGMQAFLLTFGLVEAFRYSSERPTYAQSREDFEQSVWGLRALMHWNDRVVTVQELSMYFIKRALQSLEMQGFKEFSRRLLLPLRQELAGGVTQAGTMRGLYKKLISEGANREQAIIAVLQEQNKIIAETV